MHRVASEELPLPSAELARRRVTWTACVDASTEAFERELLERVFGVGDDEPPIPLDLPLQQRHAWLRWTRREARLFQARDERGRAAMQVVVYVERSRVLPWDANGIAHKLGCAASADDEAWGLRALREACERDTDLATLRLQPRRLDARSLRDFESRARRAGFRLVEPESITRTLLLDLGNDENELLASLSPKVRYKVRARPHAGVVVRRLEPEHEAACREAANASLRRTGGRASRIDWDAVFGVASEHPELVCALGLFLPARSTQPFAFVIGERHGRVAEYAFAGSFEDRELRKMPFNYVLLGELERWARAAGARYLDLGGVSDGGPDDPLAGISRFKRFLCKDEVEVGREMLATLRPVASAVTQLLRHVVRRDRDVG